MSNNFEKTVNLREKLEGKRHAAPLGESAQEKGGRKAYRQQEEKPPVIRRQAKRRAEEIDQVYNDGAGDKISRQDLRQITRPEAKRVNEPIFKRITIILAFIIISLIGYGLFFRGESEPTTDGQEATKWYAVKLVTEEIYYGQISDTAADPIIINNVYYNYDQLNPSADSEQGKSETGSLRLVKRGKETHGPEGTMNVVRSQVVYMEPLKEDSKVLKAILDYER